MRNDLIVSMCGHYYAANMKHPYFADFWTRNNHEFYAQLKDDMKDDIEHCAKNHDVPARLVLDAEIAEVFEAITRGDYGQAREEIFDAIAVLMRMVDVIDGKAKFGNPHRVDRRCANHDCRNNDSRGVCMRKGGVCACANCADFKACEGNNAHNCAFMKG